MMAIIHAATAVRYTWYALTGVVKEVNKRVPRAS